MLISASTAPGLDEAAIPAIPFEQPFFGTYPTSGPTVTLNGMIRFGEPESPTMDYNLQPLGMSDTTRILPFWVDLHLGSAGSLLEHIGANDSYYGFTWQNMESVDYPGNLATFQAIFFDKQTILHGIQFNPGDIAFSYGDVSMYPDVLEAVIGVEMGTSFATISALEGTRGVTASNMLGLENFPVGENQYIHFRPDGSGNYDVTIEPIPEPSATLLVGAGALLGMARRKRKN